MCLGEVFICCVVHETKPVEGRFVTVDESFIYAILSRRKHVHAFLPVSVTSFGVICVCVWRVSLAWTVFVAWLYASTASTVSASV